MSDTDTHLWLTPDRARFFLIAGSDVLLPGSLEIHSLTGEERRVDPESVAANEITESQASRWALDELGEALGDLRQGIDDKVTGLRRQFNEFNHRANGESTARHNATTDALPALIDFLKQLPRAIGQSLSGDKDRLETARATMMRLQQRMGEAGFNVDDRVRNFPDRLAKLREDPFASDSDAEPVSPERPHAPSENR